MCARPTFNITAVTLITMMMLVASCKHYRPVVDPFRLDLSITEVRSPEEIEDIVRASLAKKYSPTNIAEGYTVYNVTNGPARWVFLQASNAPRGLGMFNLYCYEWKKPDLWLLSGYVPVYECLYPNMDDPCLSFELDKDYVNVVFRGAVIFTITCKKVR